MPKIEDITENSNMDEFIKVESISEIVDGINLNTYNLDTKEELIKEMLNGGLDEYSLNIGGRAVAFEKTQEIITQFNDSCINLEEIKEELKKAAENHRTGELMQYHEKLLVAKTEAEAKRDKAQANLDYFEKQVKNDSWNGSETWWRKEYEGILEDAKNQVEHWEELISLVEQDPYYRN